MRRSKFYAPWYEGIATLVIVGLGSWVGFALTGFLFKIVYKAFMFGWNQI